MLEGRRPWKVSGNLERSRRTSRRKGRGTVGRLSWDLERASSAPGLRPGKQGLPITGGAGKWRAVERQSEGVVVVRIGGTTQPVRSEGPLLHRCHAMLLTHIHIRLLQPGLAELTDPDPPMPTTLRTTANAYRRALDQLTQLAA